MKVDGKGAIVTGAGTGVGAATAKLLASKGCRVAVGYRKSAEEAEGVVTAIEGAGGEAFAFRADVAEDADCRAVVAATVERFGRLDLLVNNAGVSYRFGALETSDEHWQAALDINVNAVCPGIVQTNMLSNILTGRSDDSGNTSNELRDAMVEEIPIGRANEADDVAALAVFLAGPGSRNITGQAFNVDGGMIMS